MEVEKKDTEHHEEATTCSTAGLIVFILGLIGGTFSAIFCKMAFDSTSEGLNGEVKPFSKPITVLFLMFSGMVPAIIIWAIQQQMREPFERERLTMKLMLLIIVPCLCDLLCTLLLLVAQLFITASMWQMLRGTVICITAILKSVVLRHKLRKHMWVGVGVITVAMILVACTSLFNSSAEPEPGSRDPRIGVLLVLLGCLAQGVQYVFEEKVMAVDDVPPLVVIGMEGVWGAVLTLVVVYPVAYLVPGSDNGSYENPWDSITMIMNSRWLQCLLLAFMFTVTIYNCMAVYVTRYLSAIWHAILDNFRPITIWGVDLLIFYYILPGSAFGESWTPASYMQLGGLMVLFFGTAVYNGSVMVCDSGYQSIPDAQADDKHLVMRTEAAMTSSTLTRSPLVHKAASKAGSTVMAPSPLVTRPVRKLSSEV